MILLEIIREVIPRDRDGVGYAQAIAAYCAESDSEKREHYVNTSLASPCDESCRGEHKLVARALKVKKARVNDEVLVALHDQLSTKGGREALFREIVIEMDAIQSGKRSPGRPPAEEPASSQLQIRCTPREKSAWVKAAQRDGSKLSPWVIKALNAAAGG